MTPRLLGLVVLAAGCGPGDDAPAGSDGGGRDAPVVDACVPGAPGGGGTIHFDELADGAAVGEQYAGLGVRFATPSGLPVAYGRFASPVSAPNYLLGEYEDADLNPGPEHGNNRPALTIALTFVAPVGGRPATTTSVSLREVFTNQGNVTRALGYDAGGAMVASAQIVGAAVSGQTLSLSHAAGLARVEVVFDAAGTGGLFEDHAGIDAVVVAPLTSSCR